MDISAAGVSFIKSFEGLFLEAYPDPGTGGDPWTIGYGCTEGVKPGMRITEDQAEAMLAEELDFFVDAVNKLLPILLSQEEFDAMVSFSYNCGAGALQKSTLRKRLLAGEERCIVYNEELPKWVNGGNGPMPGLVRRRHEEAAMACKGAMKPVSQPPSQPEPIMSEFILDAVEYYKGYEHQRDAFLGLWEVLTTAERDRFIKTYRNVLEAPGAPSEPSEPKFPLDIPYFYQRDSKTGHGERMCFSSSMAMALDYIDPDAIQGDDDWYLEQVFKFGDSVSASAQVEAAEYLGFDAEFRTDGSEQDLIEILDKGTPIPIGILHKGSISAPSGGGHWICLIGYGEEHFDVHDPFGRLDLTGGGYHIDNGPTAGKFQRYNRADLMKRWLIDGSGSDGWYMILS